MATRREFLAWLAGGTFGVVAGAVPAGADTAITVLTGATLIDGTGSPPAPDMVLVLAGEKIVAIGRHPARPRGVRVVDLGGRFVIGFGCWLRVPAGVGDRPQPVQLPLLVGRRPAHRGERCTAP